MFPKGIPNYLLVPIYSHFDPKDPQHFPFDFKPKFGPVSLTWDLFQLVAIELVLLRLLTLSIS